MRPVLRWGIVPLLSAMLLSSTPVTADSGDAVPGWLPVGTLTKSGGPNGARVAMGDDSSVTVVWETTTGSGPLRSVQAVTRVPGEEWSAPVELSGAAGGRRPEIAMSQETVAIWRTSSFPFAVQVSSRGGQAGWSAPITLSSPGVSSDDPRVVINPWSTAVATWVADGVLMAASKPYQGAWSTSEALSDPLHPVLGQTVLASTGQETVAAWIESVDGHDLGQGCDPVRHCLGARPHPLGARHRRQQPRRRSGDRQPRQRRGLDPHGIAAESRGRAGVGRWLVPQAATLRGRLSLPPERCRLHGRAAARGVAAAGHGGFPEDPVVRSRRDDVERADSGVGSEDQRRRGSSGARRAARIGDGGLQRCRGQDPLRRLDSSSRVTRQLDAAAGVRPGPRGIRCRRGRRRTRQHRRRVGGVPGS